MKPLLVPIAVWLDDWLGHGIRNPLKKWWLDMEIVDGNAIEPSKGVNQRDLNIKHKVDPTEQKIAYYHANDMPPPNSTDAVVIDRKAALKAKELLETPLEALARIAAGEAKPKHYIPTPPLDNLKGPGSEVKKKDLWWGKN